MAGKTAVFVALSTLLLAGGAFAQTTQVINRLVPVTAKITNINAPAVIVTPQSPARRRLSELPFAHTRGLRASLFQSFLALFTAVIGAPALDLPPAFIAEFEKYIVPALLPSNSTRKLLQAPGLTFYGSIKQQLLTDQAAAVYIFNQDSRDFLTAISQSGTTFSFQKAVLELPQEQTTTVVPPSVSSPTAFLSTDPSSPTIVRLSTLKATGFVPSVGLRFDYKILLPTTTPYVSFYFTDFIGKYPSGVSKAGLLQTFGIFIGKDGTIYPGQTTG